MTPPSPSLSARRTNTTYLTDTISVIDQKTSEITPYTSPRVGRTAPLSMENTVCSAYSGLVPMSPYTTPSAPSISAARPTCAAPAWGGITALGGASGAADPLGTTLVMTAMPTRSPRREGELTDS